MRCNRALHAGGDSLRHLSRAHRSMSPGRGRACCVCACVCPLQSFNRLWLQMKRSLCREPSSFQITVSSPQRRCVAFSQHTNRRVCSRSTLLRRSHCAETHSQLACSSRAALQNTLPCTAEGFLPLHLTCIDALDYRSSSVRSRCLPTGRHTRQLMNRRKRPSAHRHACASS